MLYYIDGAYAFIVKSLALSSGFEAWWLHLITCISCKTWSNFRCWGCWNWGGGKELEDRVQVRRLWSFPLPRANEGYYNLVFVCVRERGSLLATSMPALSFFLRSVKIEVSGLPLRLRDSGWWMEMWLTCFLGMLNHRDTIRGGGRSGDWRLEGFPMNRLRVV